MGKPAFCQALNPPCKAAVLLIPLPLSMSAAPALECSLGQEQ
jgi:hypothetical protein